MDSNVVKTVYFRNACNVTSAVANCNYLSFSHNNLNASLKLYLNKHFFCEILDIIVLFATCMHQVTDRLL